MEMSSTEFNSAEQKNTDNIRYVNLTRKKNEKIGITLSFQKKNQCLISQIKPGSQAFYSTELNVGDVVLEINGRKPNDFNMKFLEEIMNTQQDLILKRLTKSKDVTGCCNIFVRAMLEYDPEKDSEAIAQRFGLKYEIGDILNLYCTRDSNWWKAKKLSENNQISFGIIPSHKLQMQRIIEFFDKWPTDQLQTFSGFPRHHLQINMIPEQFNRKLTSILSRLSSRIPSKISLCRSISSRSDYNQSSLKKQISNQINQLYTSMDASLSICSMSSCNSSLFAKPQEGAYEIDLDCLIFDDASSSLSTFSEFMNDLQNPPMNKDIVDIEQKKKSDWFNYSPIYYAGTDFIPYEEVFPVTGFIGKCIILLGVHGVGKKELKDSLLQTYSDRFVSPVLYTTRTRRMNEVNGVDYHFITKEEMAEKIMKKEFLDYSCQKSIMYGISMNSVRELLHQDKMIILDISSESFKFLRTSEFNPLIIFIACDPNLPKVGSLYKNGEFNGALEMMVKESELMQFIYRPFIDLILVQKSVEKTMNDIINYIESTKKSLRWIPYSWI